MNICTVTTKLNIYLHCNKIVTLFLRLDQSFKYFSLFIVTRSLKYKSLLVSLWYYNMIYIISFSRVHSLLYLFIYFRQTGIPNMLYFLRDISHGTNWMLYYFSIIHVGFVGLKRNNSFIFSISKYLYSHDTWKDVFPPWEALENRRDVNPVAFKCTYFQKQYSMQIFKTIKFILYNLRVSLHFRHHSDRNYVIVTFPFLLTLKKGSARGRIEFSNDRDNAEKFDKGERNDLHGFHGSRYHSMVSQSFVSRRGTRAWNQQIESVARFPARPQSRLSRSRSGFVLSQSAGHSARWSHRFSPRRRPSSRDSRIPRRPAFD